MTTESLSRVRSETSNPERRRLYQIAIVVAIGGNFLLAAAKGFVAWLSGSSAVFSDAANSMSDTLYSLLMGMGLYLAQRPADESHPQGHSRFEPLVSLLIAGAMGVAGVSAVAQSIQRFFGDAKGIEPGWPTIVLIGSALVKIGMYAVARLVGQRANSPAIRASARDNLVDILTSFGALVGVWGSSLIHPFFDPALGFAVALGIFRATWQILHENLGYLTGRGAPPKLTKHIAFLVSGVSGVKGVHRVVADYVGPQLRVDIHVKVNREIILEHAHAIEEEVRKKVEALPDVDLAYVHIEPVPSR